MIKIFVLLIFSFVMSSNGICEYYKALEAFQAKDDQVAAKEFLDCKARGDMRVNEFLLHYAHNRHLLLSKEKTKEAEDDTDLSKAFEFNAEERNRLRATKAPSADVLFKSAKYLRDSFSQGTLRNPKRFLNDSQMYIENGGGYLAYAIGVHLSKDWLSTNSATNTRNARIKTHQTPAYYFEKGCELGEVKACEAYFNWQNKNDKSVVGSNLSYTIGMDVSRFFPQFATMPGAMEKLIAHKFSRGVKPYPLDIKQQSNWMLASFAAGNRNENFVHELRGMVLHILHENQILKDETILKNYGSSFKESKNPFALLTHEQQNFIVKNLFYLGDEHGDMAIASLQNAVSSQDPNLVDIVFWARHLREKSPHYHERVYEYLYVFMQGEYDFEEIEPVLVELMLCAKALFKTPVSSYSDEVTNSFISRMGQMTPLVFVKLLKGEELGIPFVADIIQHTDNLKIRDFLIGKLIRFFSVYDKELLCSITGLTSSEERLRFLEFLAEYLALHPQLALVAMRLVSFEENPDEYEAQFRQAVALLSNNLLLMDKQSYLLVAIELLEKKSALIRDVLDVGKQYVAIVWHKDEVYSAVMMILNNLRLFQEAIDLSRTKTQPLSEAEGPVLAQAHFRFGNYAELEKVVDESVQLKYYAALYFWCNYLATVKHDFDQAISCLMVIPSTNKNYEWAKKHLHWYRLLNKKQKQLAAKAKIELHENVQSDENEVPCNGTEVTDNSSPKVIAEEEPFLSLLDKVKENDAIELPSDENEHAVIPEAYDPEPWKQYAKKSSSRKKQEMAEANENETTSFNDAIDQAIANISDGTSFRDALKILQEFALEKGDGIGPATSGGSRYKIVCCQETITMHVPEHRQAAPLGYGRSKDMQQMLSTIKEKKAKKNKKEKKKERN